MPDVQHAADNSEGLKVNGTSAFTGKGNVVKEDSMLMTLERSLPLLRGLSKWPAAGTRKGQESLQLDPIRRAYAVGGPSSSCAEHEDVLSRRRFFRRVAEGVVALSIPSTVFARDTRMVDEAAENGGPGTHPETVKVMEAAYYAELVAHLHYQVFSRIALVEGYSNIAYLFVALGTSEFVHASKFKTVLSDLAAEPGDMSPLTLNTSTTKANLEKAARNELEKIDVMYPSFVSRIQPEGHKDSLRYSAYAWESHKQHRHHIQKIERWVGSFFGAVAKRLERQTGPFFVCTNCGSTVTELPVDACQICHDHVHLHTEIARPTG